MVNIVQICQKLRAYEKRPVVVAWSALWTHHIPPIALIVKHAVIVNHIISNVLTVKTDPMSCVVVLIISNVVLRLNVQTHLKLIKHHLENVYLILNRMFSYPNMIEINK
jgi:hypothetical protein